MLTPRRLANLRQVWYLPINSKIFLVSTLTTIAFVALSRLRISNTVSFPDWVWLFFVERFFAYS